MNSIKSFLLVGLGGFTGATLRYVVVGWVERTALFGYQAGTFSFGTLSVNMIGCFVVGFLGAVAAARDLVGGDAWLLLVVGVLGGFTTYSSFALDTLLHGNAGDWQKAFLYVALHLIVGLMAVWMGFALGLRISPQSG